LAAADRVHVGHRAAAGGGVAAQAMAGGAPVDQATDGLAHHVVDPGLATGAYGDEVLLGNGGGRGGSGVTPSGGDKVRQCVQAPAVAPCSCSDRSTAAVHPAQV